MTQDSSADHADLCHYFSDEGRTYQAVPFRGGFRVFWHLHRCQPSSWGTGDTPIIRDVWEHYTAFADLKDRFALSSVAAVEELDRLLGFADTRVSPDLGPADLAP